MAFAEAGFTVDGIDLSSELLSLAIESCQDAVLGLSDIREMPFDNDIFEGVWAMASLVHMGHTAVEQALAEIRLVLKPNGWLFLTLKCDESDAGRWEGKRPVMRR